jgi:hypothetical protein
MVLNEHHLGLWFWGGHDNLGELATLKYIDFVFHGVICNYKDNCL